MEDNFNPISDENEETSEPEELAVDINSKEETEALPVETISESEVDPSIEEPAHPLVKEETKVRRFFRKLIRWTFGFLIVFGLGLITGIFAFYRPATQEADQAIRMSESELESANSQISSLEGQITHLETEVDHLQTYQQINEDLLAEQSGYELHIAVLDARLDATNALLALSEENYPQAQLILEKTTGTLDTISDLLDEDQRGAVSSMKQRLELVLSEMEDDPYAAQSDLDVLATNLLQLEDALFTE